MKSLLYIPYKILTHIPFQRKKFSTTDNCVLKKKVRLLDKVSHKKQEALAWGWQMVGGRSDMVSGAVKGVGKPGLRRSPNCLEEGRGSHF
jgi:hypothetical protein